MGGPRRKSTGQIGRQVAITDFIGAVQCKVDEDVQFKVPFLPLTSPEEPTPAAFRPNLPLYAHQQRSLHRMLQIEARDDAVARFNFGMLDYYSRGGCLADDIGMGKTATMLALIVSEPINVTIGGNLLVAPPHLLAQWELEVRKFVAPGEIDVVVGLRAYLSMDRSVISNRTLVLVGVDEAVASRAYFYDFHRLYPREIGPRGNMMSVDEAAMTEYEAAAKFVNKAYSGLVWTTPLHIPDKPWRRVVFEEVQDLVLPGREAQDCFIQLTRRCEHVWLITATPFPEKVDSIYANNQLLGFKRLRLQPHDPAFDAIKRKLYLRNCAQVKQDAITNRIRVRETYVTVQLHPRELLLYNVEHVLAGSKSDDALDISADVTSSSSSNSVETLATAATTKATTADRSDVWLDKYDAARQSCVHVGISDRVLARDRVQRDGQAVSTLPQIVAVKPPAEVYKNEMYHLSRELAVAKLRQTEVATMEAATRNTVAICRTLSHQVYSTVADCFADLDASGLAPFFSRGGETDAGFRMLHSHVSSSGTGPFIEPTDLLLYSADEIEGYLRQYWDSHAGIARLGAIMESTLTERCPRARSAVDAQLAALAECEAMQSAAAATATDVTDPTAHAIPFYGSKITHVVEYLSRLPRVKAVLFTMWPAALRVLATALQANGLSCATFLAHQSSDVKAAQVQAFVTGDADVLLLHSLTSASGINLQVASHVVFVDPVGYSATQASTLEQQAIGRVLRMGQVHAEVNVVRFVAEQTLEAALYDAIHAAMTTSKAAHDAFFDGDATAANAYVCDGFDAPVRRIVRMEIRPDGSASVSTSVEATAKATTLDDDDAIEIAGAMSLEDAINARIAAAAASGVVFDLTGDTDDDGETLRKQLAAAAAAQDDDAKQQRKRRRLTSHNADPATDGSAAAALEPTDPFARVRVKLERNGESESVAYPQDDATLVQND